MLKTAIKHSIVASVLSLATLSVSSVALAGELSSSFKSVQLTKQTTSTVLSAGPVDGEGKTGGGEVNAPPGNYPCPINLCFHTNSGETSCGGNWGQVVIVQTTEEYCEVFGYGGRTF